MFFPASAPRSEKSGNNRRKRWVHRNSEKHLQCTTDLSRRAPWGDQRHSENHAGNANTRLWAGRTGKSQCSPYLLEIRGNGTVGIDDSDHERHSGATKNNFLITNQPSEAKRKFLLLELREQFYSREKNLISKESDTSRRSVLQEIDGCQRKGVWIRVRGNR